MSVFTNPATGAAEHAAAYVDAILELLGERDPVVVLRETVDALPRAIDGLSPEQLRRPERPGKWSIVQILQHLADSEIVGSWRFRLILAQERPPLTGYDQDSWAARLGYEDADPAEAVALFTMLRRANLRLLARASTADLARAGVHAERGEESLAHLRRLYAGHRAPSIQHPAPSTQHSAPSTQHSALSTQHPALSTQHPAPNTMYVPTSWAFPATNRLIVRTAGPAAAMTGAIRSAVRTPDPRQALFEIQTMEDYVSGTLSQTRLSAALVGAFALAALLFDAVGVAGVVANGVSQSPSLLWPASCRRLAPPASIPRQRCAARRTGLQIEDWDSRFHPNLRKPP